MRVITLNLNGIRAAWKKGVSSWLLAQDADVICLQETRAQRDDMSPEMLSPAMVYARYVCAERRGYSGVAMWTKQAPERWVESSGMTEFDDEGRCLRADLQIGDTQLSIVSLYFPSGSSEERQEAKWRFLAGVLPMLEALRTSGREILLCGDWNIAHQNIDLTNWKTNQKHSGFLPEERQWLTDFLARGWVDVYRNLYPKAGSEAYTWWSNRGQAYAKNVGWRIDYQIATPGLAAHAQKASVYKARRFSDHAPLLVDYAGISSTIS